VSGRRELDEGLGHTPQSFGHLTPLRRSGIGGSSICFAARQAHPPIGSFDPGVRLRPPPRVAESQGRPGYEHLSIDGGLAAVTASGAVYAVDNGAPGPCAVLSGGVPIRSHPPGMFRWPSLSTWKLHRFNWKPHRRGCWRWLKTVGSGRGSGPRKPSP